MLKRKMFLMMPGLCAGAIYADSDTVLIPEGKITSYTTVFGDITPSAGPRVIDGYGIFITGDYIYWTAHEDNLAFATTGVRNDTGGPSKKGRKYTPRFKYDSGLKVGVGFNFGHDKWDMYIDYTWFNPHHSHKRVYENAGSPLTNTIPLALQKAYMGLYSASAAWSLNFNVFDWELGRNFYVSKFLSMRPFFGLKGTWQKQSMHVDYSFRGQGGVRSQNQNNFSGIGPRAGVDTAWHFPGTWSFFADLAFSAIWGAFYIEREDYLLSSGKNSINEVESFHSTKPVMELGIGIRKEEWFHHDRYHFSLQVGWETQIWYSQNQFSFNPNASSGDLNIQGVTVKGRFDF